MAHEATATTRGLGFRFFWYRYEVDSNARFTRLFHHRYPRELHETSVQLRPTAGAA